MNIKRPPVMLEGGYNGWIQFIQRNRNNISEWTESFTMNDSINYVSIIFIIIIIIYIYICFFFFFFFFFFFSDSYY